tara:strand:+ start:258 stop:782 length:525 start_codon:yes stop_codon:yes gene_type:complete
MTKHTFAMADVTEDTRGLARIGLGYDWNYLADTETLIFGTDDDATLQWTGSALASSVGLTFTTGTITVADGGAVTQGTSKATTAVLSTLTGAVTTHAASLADDAIVTFTLTNTTVAATDNVILNHKSGGTLGSYNVQAHTMASGSFKISIQNVSGGTLSEALVLSFVVVKGAIS